MATLPERATHQRTRAFNQQLVLRAIYDRHTVSRADVARLTGLTRTTVGELVSGLLDEQLIEEVGRGPSTGGKAPILLRVRADGRHLVGLDLGEDAFNGALVDLRGHVIRRLSVPLAGHDGETAAELVMTLIEGLMNGNGSGPLLGIGVGAPGLIDTRTGNVRWAVNLAWENLPLGEMIEKRFGVPAVIANDSQAAAVAELTFGNEPGSEPRPGNLIVVRVGRGIGAGIILNGQLVPGDGSGAGEIGHMTVAGGHEACRCGRVGCLETMASMRAMVAAAHALVPTVSDEATLLKALRAGDDRIRQVVVDAGATLGTAIAAMVATINVNHVLLVGPAVALGDEWLDAIRRQAAAATLPLLAADTRIELGAGHDDVVMLGASALLMTHELGLSLAR
jgi:predicted NBD/HSP70 family sugar kinase